MTTPVNAPADAEFARPRAVAGAACLAPWGERAEGVPGGAPEELPKLVGFVLSRFSPIVGAAVVQCLGDPASEFNLIGTAGARTAMVLATMYGDTVTSDTATRRMVEGQVHSPLLFFQSVTTSILGHLTKRYGITGPLTSLSHMTDPAGQALLLADSLLESDAADQVVVIGVETAANERSRSIQQRLTAAGEPAGAQPVSDAAAVVLLRKAAPGTERLPLLASSVTEPDGPVAPEYGWLSALVAAGRTQEGRAA
ncbi:beta-ketoacyl synthase-like protein [Streptomyces puniciscabiei]|uniref:Beta-ketoacyl synthase-like protein n=1 Tax=Streptomyces puniciscabiei TaxID=164348 RepID=A0A542UF46_9ACTN|nr:beta-ketoacyl synthase chain length factor [Streptomyces puniciscabiei]TQK97692.1 beta-ketoacyl synthase-like protein [Streptomyces puniciscabiei]